MSHDPRCADLARHVLRAFRLSPAERAEETTRLADTIQRVVEDELEVLREAGR